MSQPKPPAPSIPRTVHYPDSDGQPMADNTLQYDWIVRIQSNLNRLLPDAFVAGDLLWYPIEGDNRTRAAPDVLVAVGRPKGHRSCFLAWEEGGQPEVVFEIWSPSNHFAERVRRHRFFDRHGVAEFYAYDPERNDFSAFIRGTAGLEPVATDDGWVSPRLGVRFKPGPDTLTLTGPAGEPFLTFDEIADQAEAARIQAAEAQAQAAEAQAQAQAAIAEAHAAIAEAHAAEARARALADRLRALGIDPDAV